jgi:peroxin-11B
MLESNLIPMYTVLRLGKPMEHLQAALRAAVVPGPAGEQILTIGKQVAYFGYLSYDMFVWVRLISSPLFNRC